MVAYHDTNKRNKKECIHGISPKKNCKKCKQDYEKEYYKNHPESRNTSRCKVRKNQRIKIIKLLGNKCCNPFNLPHLDWCNDIRCLQIDHINGDGHKERIKTNPWAYYKKILKSIKENKNEYQLLCANCNWIKRCINNEN
jgi:hypothetical protein